MYKFEAEDKIFNIVETHPQNIFIFYNRSASGPRIFYNNQISETGKLTSNVKHVPEGYISLYEINVDRPAGELVYPFITKEGSLTSFKTISTTNFNSDFSYGDTITGSYPLSASIRSDYIDYIDRPRITALKNTLEWWSSLSPHYRVSSSFGDKTLQDVRMITIPSIFFGSGIERGSVRLQFYVTGTLVAELNDEKRNGELVQVSGSTTGSVAGVCLYDEGFILLTGSWNLGDIQQDYNGDGNTYFAWKYFGETGSANTANSSSYSLYFKGTTEVPVRTLFVHAPPGELSYSNNPTYIQKFTGSFSWSTGSSTYIENTEIPIKNITKTNFSDPTGAFGKTTYISKVALYDENKNLIGIAKLANPLRKRETDGYTIKMKLDY